MKNNTRDPAAIAHSKRVDPARFYTMTKPALKGLENHELYYQPEKWRPAKTIYPAGFNSVLIWPIAMSLNEAKLSNTQEIEKAVLKQVQLCVETKDNQSPTWQQVTDLFNAANAQVLDKDSFNKTKQGYSDFIYFHDFISDFLCHGEDKTSPKEGGITNTGSLYLLKRDDIRTAKISTKGRTLVLPIERFQLYFSKTGIAMLLVEFSWRRTDYEALSLAEVQTLLDEIRRCYPPYMKKGDEGHSFGGCLESLVWCDNKGKAITLNDNPPEPQGSVDEKVMSDWLNKVMQPDAKGRRFQPLFNHWQQAIHPLQFESCKACEIDDIKWRHIVDERLPMVYFVSLSPQWGSNTGARDAYQSVSRGDWMRLCFLDAAGTDPLPYNPLFLQNFERDNCYDRFHASDCNDNSVRYLFSGYGFGAVGAGWFFDNLALNHTRTMYTNMAILAHFENASLISISAQISQTIDIYESEKNQPHNNQAAVQAKQNLAQRLHETRSRLMHFVHRYRFTNVSNQVQPTELYALWRKHLRLDHIFSEVHQEVQNASDYLLAMQEASATNAAERLNLIATVGLALGLIFSLFGMNVLFSSEWVSAVLSSFMPTFFPLDSALFSTLPHPALARFGIELILFACVAVLMLFCLEGIKSGYLDKINIIGDEAALAHDHKLKGLFARLRSFFIALFFFGLAFMLGSYKGGIWLTLALMFVIFLVFLGYIGLPLAKRSKRS